jgi:hypothetical protein
VIELIEDGCSVPAEWNNAMVEGFASLHVDNARVVTTVNFERIVRELTGGAAYTTGRGGGVVAAKTVTRPDGSTVVLNYNELSSRTPAYIQKLAAHEAGHVLIDARGTEETSGNRDDDESDWQWLLKALGAQAMVELRIERSLAELGYSAAESAAPIAVNHSLIVTNVEVVNAVIDPRSSADPGYLRDAVVTTLNHVTKLLAYVAAPLVADRGNFSPTELLAEGLVNWQDYIAPTWSERLSFWSSIPSAMEPIPIETWRTTLRKSFLLEQKFLLDFGFAFEDAPDGQYAFLRKGSDDLFTERFQRARAQTGIQPD